MLSVLHHCGGAPPLAMRPSDGDPPETSGQQQGWVWATSGLEIPPTHRSAEKRTILSLGALQREKLTGFGVCREVTEKIGGSFSLSPSCPFFLMPRPDRSGGSWVFRVPLRCFPSKRGLGEQGLVSGYCLRAPRNSALAWPEPVYTPWQSMSKP